MAKPHLCLTITPALQLTTGYVNKKLINSIFFYNFFKNSNE